MRDIITAVLCEIGRNRVISAHQNLTDTKVGEKIAFFLQIPKSLEPLSVSESELTPASKSFGVRETIETY